MTRSCLFKLPGGGTALLLTVCLTSVAAASDDPVADKCVVGKSMAAGKYAACVVGAEAILATTGDQTTYYALLSKCSLKLSKPWAKLESAAIASGSNCPSQNDGQAMKNFVDSCMHGVTDACMGNMLPNLVDCAALRNPLATGQTTSYGPGSDGDLQKGAARSFTDNGDGTITDNVTGLMWEKKSDDGSIHDWDNAYTWGDTSPPYTMNGTMVTTFLASLNGNEGFAGHTDWRIPNRFELETLVNLGAAAPSTYTAFNADCSQGCTVTTCSCTRSDDYWSSTTTEYFPDLAWLVNFNFGGVTNDEKTYSYAVRAVRAGS